MKPIVLCILDGMGINENTYGNAFNQADTPNFDYLWKNYPHSLIEASGELVGLPKGQMGNSEVGHMNLGAGKVVYQSLEYLNNKITTKEFFSNNQILKTINHTKKNNSTLHVVGLISNGGIHSHINHLFSIIELCRENNLTNISFHLFTDGRDTLPNSGKEFVMQLENKIKEVGFGTISSIAGRYYGMDRDNRWDRVEKSYNALIGKNTQNYSTPLTLIEENYQNNITDEFIKPGIINHGKFIENNDGVILFNFRPDRVRQISEVLTNNQFNQFEREYINNLSFVSMFFISDKVKGNYAFELEKSINTLGEYLEKLNKTQLRMAETEKYAHVTYFFDNGVEKNRKGMTKVLIPSPKVATYDLMPEMSAYLVTETLLKEIDKNVHEFIIVNYANGDMVGHTGMFEAAKKACEVVDKCLGKLYDKVKEKNGILLITADHGNCDVMLDKSGNILTQHSLSKVPLIINDKNLVLKDGKLADIAPTMLFLKNIEIPKEMTGNILVNK